MLMITACSQKHSCIYREHDVQHETIMLQHATKAEGICITSLILKNDNKKK